jgi:hypothetical protein
LFSSHQPLSVCSYHCGRGLEVVQSNSFSSSTTIKAHCRCFKGIPNDLHGDCNHSPGNHDRLRHSLSFPEEGNRQVYCFSILLVLFFALLFCVCFCLTPGLLSCSRQIMYFHYSCAPQQVHHPRSFPKEFPRHISQVIQDIQSSRLSRRTFRVPTRTLKLKVHLCAGKLLQNKNEITQGKDLRSW